MADLIHRGYLRKMLMYEPQYELPKEQFELVMKLIDDAPAVDAVPVVHGHWIKSCYCNIREKENMMRETDKWTTYKCSVCGTSNGRTGR